MDVSGILGLLTDPKILALLAPMLVGLVKKGTDKLPKWAMPILSAVLGAVMSTLVGGDASAGVMAGLAGVGVREAVDQAKKAVK